MKSTRIFIHRLACAHILIHRHLKCANKIDFLCRLTSR